MLLRTCENSLGEEMTTECHYLLSTRTVNTSCSVYMFAGSQRLTQEVHEMTNYIVRSTNEPTVMNDF